MDNYSYQCVKTQSGDFLLYWINRGGVSEQVSENFDIRREHAYPYCAIHYITGGAGSLIYKGREYSLREGQLFILDAYEAHHYRTDPVRVLALDWIEFSGGDAQKLVQHIIGEHSPVLEPAVSGVCDKYLHRIFTLLKREENKYQVQISRLIYTILSTLLCTGHGEYGSRYEEPAPEFLRKVTGYIEDHLDSDLSLERLSGFCNFNPSYFTRIFHKMTGRTPAKYVLDKRIERAKKMLVDSSKPVELISDELNFCNASHFIRVFKKTEGMTPVEYRKQGTLYKLYRS